MRDFHEITYLEDYQKDVNFSFLQSLVLIAAYICGINKESYDIKLFENRSGAKLRQVQSKGPGKQDKSQPYMLGKSKRFNLDRFTAILDFLLSLYAEKCTENQLHGHSLEFYAALNSLTNDGLLKKSFLKRAMGPDAGSAASEDLTTVFFKCNFDFNFIQEVARKIDFILEDFLLGAEGKES